MPKRLACLLLAMLMLSSLLPVAVFAEGEETQPDTAFEEPVSQNSGDFAPAEADELPAGEPEQPIITEPPTTTEPPIKNESEQLPVAEPEQPELPDSSDTEPPAEEQEELFENMLLFSELDEDMSPYAAELAPGDVNEMPTGLGLEVSISNSAPAVGDTVTYTLAPTGVTPSGNSRPLTEYGFI